MAVTKINSNNIPVKKRGRPAGTRLKHRQEEWTIEQYKQAYTTTIETLKQYTQKIADLKEDIDSKENDLQRYENRLVQYQLIEVRMEELERNLKTKEIRELKLFGIIEYLEDKVKSLLNK